MKRTTWELNETTHISVYAKDTGRVDTINKFDFHRGAMYLFSGPMSSGKSTLMEILAKVQNINQNLVFYEVKDISLNTLLHLTHSNQVWVVENLYVVNYYLLTTTLSISPKSLALSGVIKLSLSRADLISSTDLFVCLE